MYTRNQTRVISIGDVKIGGGNPVVIQSMTNTKTENVEETVKQILALEKAGCQIIRCTVPTMKAAQAFTEIKKQIHIPLVADIHFDYKLAIAAMEHGADKIRINPGNIGGEENIRKVVETAKKYHVPIRVGVNSGSLEKPLVKKYNGVTAQGLVESALDKVASGNIKSAVGLGIILNQGIGDTIRVSLTGDPVNEIASAKLILKTLGLRSGGIEVVSCPTCGRTNIDLIPLANQVETMAADFENLNLKVAVMGCVVNGPGEAKEADVGIAGGNGEGLLIKKGEVIRKVPEDQLLDTLRYELEHWGE